MGDPYFSFQWNSSDYNASPSKASKAGTSGFKGGKGSAKFMSEDSKSTLTRKNISKSLKSLQK